MARPRKEVDIDLLTDLVKIQCTARECASVLHVSEDTLDRRLKEEGYDGFADFFKKHQDEGKTSLRRAQWNAALDGNPTMLVWLGKQYLDQRDKMDTESTVKRDYSDMSQEELLEQIERARRIAEAGAGAGQEGGEK